MNLSSVTIAVLGSAGYGALCAAATGSVAHKTECDRPVYLWEPADTGETAHQLPVTYTTDIYEALESADIVVVPWDEQADSCPEEMTGAEVAVRGSAVVACVEGVGFTGIGTVFMAAVTAGALTPSPRAAERRSLLNSAAFW